MTRLLFWGLLILCALVAVRLAVQRNQRRRRPPPAKTQRRGRFAQSEPMVACAHCGVYLPQSDALALHGQTWCCREHAQQRDRV